MEKDLELPSLQTILNNCVEGEILQNDPVTASEHMNKSLSICNNIVNEALQNGQSVLCVTLNPSTGIPKGRGVRCEYNGVLYTADFNGLHSMRNVDLQTPLPDCFVKCESLENGEWNGQIDMCLENGHYTGDTANGTPHGHGKVIRYDGSSYAGDWVHGSRVGQGKEVHENGSYYSGQWAGDMPNGYGEYVDETGTYLGQWRDGKRIGNGKFVAGPQTVSQIFHIHYDESGIEIARYTHEEFEIKTLKAQIDELEQKIKNKSDDDVNKCKVCLDAPVTRCLNPCRHACICDSCEKRIKEKEAENQTLASRFGRFKCPICRSICRTSEPIILN